MRLRYQIILLLILSVFLLIAETKLRNRKGNKKTNGTNKKVSRIVGGSPAKISSLKYLVNLRLNKRFFCGGTLVNSLYVVTAAHCVKGVSASRLTVVGGQTQLSGGGVTRSVAKIMIPSKFNMNSMNYDVAVLKLSNAMTGTNIAPIGLCNKAWKTGNLVQVSGWGLTRESANTVPDNVQTVAVPIISKNTCSKAYRGQARLTSTMFCASVPGQKDSCQGDSGGPVIYNQRLCGIVSWGIGCARKKYPGVYTNVRSVLSFINSSLKK